MRFIVDMNLPPALARWLAVRGYTAEHVASVLGPQAQDSDVWRYALDMKATAVTKDVDFAILARATSGASVILVKSGNLVLADFIPWFAARLPKAVDRLSSGISVAEMR